MATQPKTPAEIQAEKTAADEQALAKKAASDEEAAQKQDVVDATAEVDAETALEITERAAAKAKARAEEQALRDLEAGDVVAPNIPEKGDSDLELALKALGAEVDRAVTEYVRDINPQRGIVIRNASRPPRPNANAKKPPKTAWAGVSTEDRINYEVDRLAAVRRSVARK